MMSFSLSGGVEVVGFISPTDPLDTYPVIDPLYGIDGLRNVDTLTDLNNIPNLRRRAGMLVGVNNGSQYYKLNASPWTGTITDWTAVSMGIDTFVTGTTFNPNQAILTRNDSVEVFKLSGGTNVLLSNPSTNEIVINVSADVDTNTFITGFTYDNSNNLTISRNDGVDFSVNIDTMSGLTINGDLLVTGTTNISGLTSINSSLDVYNGTIGLRTNDYFLQGTSTGGTNVQLIGVYSNDEILIGNQGYTNRIMDDTIVDGQLSVLSGLTVNGPLSACTGIYTSNIYGCSPLTINDTAIFQQGINVIAGDSILQQTSATTITLTNLPNLNNTATEILARNSSTGLVEYRDVSTITPDTNTFVTGFTYDNVNTFTISRSDGVSLPATISVLSGITYYGDGSNLSGVTSEDNFVSGGTYNQSTLDINFVGNSPQTTFDVDLTSLYSAVSGDTFISSGNANAATSQLTFTYNDGSTFNVTNSAALFSDNDINVTGGTYNPSNGCVTFTTNSGTTFDVCGFLTGFTNTYVTGGTVSVSATDSDNSGTIGLFYKNSDGIPRTLPFEDTFTTGSTYDNGTALATFTRNDGNTYTLDLSSLTGGTSDTNSFSTGGTVTQSATSGSSEVVVQIVGNLGFTPFNITGLTDTFVNDFSISSNTFTISQNDGSSFVATADTIDLASVLSAVTFDIATSGSISATTFNGNTYNGGTFNGTFVGDGSGLTGITDNFVSGGTYNTGTQDIDFVGNSPETTFSVDLSSLVNNITGDTFVTGTTFSSNQATVTRNDGFNVLQLTGGTNVTLTNPSTNQIKIDVNIPADTNTFVTGGTYNDTTDIITLTRNDGGIINITGVTNTFTTGSTYDNGTALATFTKNDGTTYTLDLSTIDVNDTFVTGFTYNDNNTFTITRNDGVDITSSINTVSALTVTNYIDYTTGTKPSAISGRTYFDRDENALSYFPETPANDVTINIGQESVIRVHNNTGIQINNGEVCHITSEEPSVNGVPSVVLAIATGSTTTGSKYLVSGVATHDIPNGTEGFITSFGLVRDLNITGVTEGTEIYLSETTPGAFRYTAPDTEFRRSVVGYVVTTGATTGKILVEISNEVGFSELSESLLSVVTENNASTGTRDGGEITINSGDNTLFDVSSGSGIIVDNYTDPNNPTIQNIVWDSITGNSVTNLTGDSASYIFLDSNTNTVQFGISNPPTEADYRDNIFLGIVGHANFTNLINVFNTPIQIVSPINQHQDLTSAIGPFSINGNRVSNITGTLQLQKSVGKSYFYGGNFHTDTKVPSSITTAQLSGSTLIYATGAAVLGPTSADIDPDNYDPDGLGSLSGVPGTNQFVAHRIWHQPSQNLLIFQYGQAFYPNAATARDEFEFESYVVPPGLNETSYLAAILIAQDGDTDLDSATIIPQGKFAGTGGGGGSAADTLQTAYNNSSSPEIITDATRGAVDFRVGSGSDSDNVVTFQQNSGTINAFVEGTGDAKFTNLTGTSVTSNSAINVFNGHINIRDNSYFLQGRTVADVNVSLIGVDNQDRVFVGNAGYDTYIDSDTIVDGVLSAQTAFLTTTPTLNNSATDILVRNSSTGEVEYRPVSGITPDTDTFVSGGTYNDTTNNINFSGNSAETTFDVDLTSLVSSVSANTFVIAGTYSDSTDTISLLRNDGNFVNITGITDTFTTGATYDNGTALATFNRNDGNSYTLDLSTIDVNDTFVTGSTVSANTLTLTRNDLQDVLLLSGGTNAQFIDNGNNSITLNVTSGGGGGASVSFPWKFKEPTASSDPGSGHFRLNNTVASAITEIYVSDETNNSIDASNLLNILDVGDVIYIQQNDDATRALLFTVSASTVDNTGWFTIPVQYQQGSTIPKKDKVCGWIFASTGAEDNTVSNVGVGQGVFKQRNVNDFEFYSLSGGTNTTLTLNNDTIVIDVTTPTPTLSVVSVTGTTYSATTSDDVIGFDTSSVTPTLFLPDSTSSGTKRYEVKDIGVNSRRNPITIQAAGSDTIITTSVVSSFELSADGGAVILVSTGTGQWWQM